MKVPISINQTVIPVFDAKNIDADSFVEFIGGDIFLRFETRFTNVIDTFSDQRDDNVGYHILKWKSCC